MRSPSHQILFIILYTSTLVNSLQGIRSFEKAWTFQEKEVILSRDLTASDVTTSGENRFLYALCEDAHWKSKKTCDVVVETYTSENLTYKSSCRLNLKTENESRMIGPSFLLTQLGVEKAIFMWIDREKANWSKHEILLRGRVIDWSNCTFSDFELPVDEQNGLMDEIKFNNVLVYENSFDVFFYSKSQCGSGRCKVSFDSKAQRIGRIESFRSKMDDSPMGLVFPVADGNNGKGYYSFSWTSSKLTAIAVDKNGNERDLASVTFEGYIMFGISAKCDLLGFCWLPMRGDSTVNCIQVDAQGRSRLNVTLNFGYTVVYVGMMNLADGGFLLLQLVCTDELCLGHKSFYLSKIQADGTHSNRPLEISGIELDSSRLDRYKINLYEKNVDELCVTLAGPASLSEFDIIVERPELNFVSKCFHKKYVNK